ncbi:hypothetical protein M378DRAFT_961552 [Amanita muscaria Koide BX008]|uniref:Small ribosomal subunit protein uS10 domain-containing protein n=1 Tax=Amanita muscaria (strain Koide BX008) TaxID=946122 RepID=A0A0C2WT54_AMAMK|nr:hypothetical protein M378DRAFT_961552 [Amanita muscaria Koide BX008]
MRFSTIVISSAFVLAGMSAARFAGSDFEVEARAFNEEPELYARGGAMSKLTGGNKKDKPPSYHTAARDPPPRYEGSPNHVPHLDSFRTETDYSHNHKSPSSTSRHRRRSYYLSNDYELVARGNNPPKFGIVPLPSPIRRFDVLRSPHVHKTSRDHFEIRTHARLIDIVDPGMPSPTEQKKKLTSRNK